VPSFLRNTIANWSAFATAAAVSFFLAPFIIHRLGDAPYGIWVLLGSLVGYLGLLDLGVRSAVTRFVAGYHAKADHRGAAQAVNGALRVFAVLATLAIVISTVIAFTLEYLFKIPPGLIEDARIVVLLGGITMAAAFVGGVFSGIIAGLHRFDIDSGLEIAMTALRAAAVVVALDSGYGLVTLAVIQLVISLLRGVVSFIIVHRLYPELTLRSTGTTGVVVRQLLSFSLFTSLIQLSGTLIYYTDALVIGAVLPIALVTYYAIAASLVDYARQLVTAISVIVTPRASALQAAQGEAAAAEAILRIGAAATVVIVPIALTFLVRGESFIGIWMGPEYASRSSAVLYVLAVTVWLYGGRGIAAAGLMGVNRHRVLAVAFGAEAVANIGLSFALIGSMGIVGVALGTTIPSIVLSLGFLPWYFKQQLGIGIWRFVARIWLIPSCACFAFGIATYAFERWVGAASLLVFFAQVASILPLVALGAAFLVFSRQERAEFLARLLTALPLLARILPRGLTDGKSRSRAEIE
jgi:O-antigen/teichoic acid export membrane protein